MKNIWLQKILNIIFLFFTVVVISVACLNDAYATNPILDENLEEIDNLQRKYFKIIKRNDVLLRILREQEHHNAVLEKDDNEIGSLYTIVEVLIGNDNKHLQRLFDIIDKYLYSNTDFQRSINNYDKEITNFSIDIYKTIKATVPKEDFIKLQNSQNKWLYEVEKYENKKFKHAGIESEIDKYFCQIDIIKFRTVLLILYLSNAENIYKKQNISQLTNSKTIQSFSPSEVSSPLGGNGRLSGSGTGSDSGTSSEYGNVVIPRAINPNGAPSVDALKQADFGPFMRDLQRRIKANWNPPQGNVSKRVVLLFSIAKNGRLLGVKVLKSSGSITADRAAISAVELSAPFKPLPSEYKRSSVDLQFTFDYNVFGVTGY